MLTVIGMCFVAAGLQAWGVAIALRLVRVGTGGEALPAPAPVPREFASGEWDVLQ